MDEKKYIELEAALKANCYFCSAHLKDDSPCVEKCADYMKFIEIPTADVAPVVHGEWIADGDGYHWTYNCSICGWKDGYPFNERHNYCPNCGARMEAI